MFKLSEKEMCISIEIENNRKLFSLTVKSVLSDHSKIEETKVLKPCGSLMQVESIAECSKGGILQYF